MCYVYISLHVCHYYPHLKTSTTHNAVILRLHILEPEMRSRAGFLLFIIFKLYLALDEEPTTYLCLLYVRHYAMQVLN